MTAASTIKVITSDNSRFDVETKLLVRSGQLERLLANHPDVDDLGNVRADAQPLRLRRTDGKVFKAIVDWLNHYRDEDFAGLPKELAIFERVQMLPPPEPEKEHNLTKSLVNYDDSEEQIDATDDVHVVTMSTDVTTDITVVEGVAKKSIDIMTMPLILEKDGVLEVNPELFDIVENLPKHVAANFAPITAVTAADVRIPLKSKDQAQSDMFHEIVHCIKALENSTASEDTVPAVEAVSSAQLVVNEMHNWCKQLAISTDQTCEIDGENISIAALFNELHEAERNLEEATKSLDATRNNLPVDVPFNVVARPISINPWDIDFFAGLEKSVLLSLIVTSKTLDIFELHKRACQYAASRMGETTDEMLAFLTV